MFWRHKDAPSPGYPEKGVEDLYAAGTAAEWEQGKQEEEDIHLAYCEKIAGIQYQPESLQGMKETWEHVLQFMAGKLVKNKRFLKKAAVILTTNLRVSNTRPLVKDMLACLGKGFVREGVGEWPN